MLISRQIEGVLPGRRDPEFESALALVHSRYSTNTLAELEPRAPVPLPRAQRRDQHVAQATRTGCTPARARWLAPVRRRPAPSSTRSCARAQRLGALRQRARVPGADGRELPEAILMMIPEAWENHVMDEDLRAFYEYHSFLMEPWDGPPRSRSPTAARSAPCSTATGCARRATTSRRTARRDGVGGRACSRSSRRRSSYQGRLHPGKIFFVDLEAGRIVEDEEIKRALRRARPYREWVERTACAWPTCRRRSPPSRRNPELRFRLQQAFGYTLEDSSVLLAPMAARASGRSARWARTRRSPASRTGRSLLYRYFKQLFAQVTNPAMDSINERPVMALYSTLGAERNLLEETAGARAHDPRRAPGDHRRGARAAPAHRAARASGRARCPASTRSPRAAKGSRGARSPVREARARRCARA